MSIIYKRKGWGSGGNETVFHDHSRGKLDDFLLIFTDAVDTCAI